MLKSERDLSMRTRELRILAAAELGFELQIGCRASHSSAPGAWKISNVSGELASILSGAVGRWFGDSECPFAGLYGQFLQ
jgi:hypothetical protein